MEVSKYIDRASGCEERYEFVCEKVGEKERGRVTVT